jgi:hypothetical protein
LFHADKQTKRQTERQAETDRQTERQRDRRMADMTKLIVAFYKFAKAPKMHMVSELKGYCLVWVWNLARRINVDWKCPGTGC